ncbi:hypothetical protein HYV73_02310 [Candidatus Uhrbacteria bacterium]|nr:hypothetical protein [Candidatus Uhrbacteria bacterium]
MPNARHHQHPPKREHVLREAFPSRDRLKYGMDRLVYLAGFVLPLMTIPQLTTLYIHRDSTSLSAVTWVTYFLGSCFWFFYGIVHKERPIIFINMMLAIVQGLIVVGIFLFR